ncbi:hypothetical protein A9Q87_03400 [Flavobacteriales bacterium 34_180_T64]|nr:hypothetical protein A9Q87_03400 [Flavobacteriales bacterium 34_180_T64]
MKYLFLSIILIILSSCSKSDSSNNCNFLVNAGVNASVNLNLPEFSQLQFTSSSVYIPNQGNGGIIVINTGGGNFRAWDATDPNHMVSNCSILEIVGAEGICGCEDANTYSLFSGQSLNNPQPCGLKEYRVSSIGNNTYSITN